MVFDNLVSWKGESRIPRDFLIARNINSKRNIRQVSLEHWIEKAGYSKPFFNSKLLRSGVTYPPTIRGVEDTVFFISLCLNNTVKILKADTQSYIYRHLEESLSNRGEIQLNEVAKAVALLRKSENLPLSIRGSIDLIEKKNETNLLALKIKVHIHERQCFQIVCLLFCNTSLLRFLIVRVSQSILLRLRTNIYTRIEH